MVTQEWISHFPGTKSHTLIRDVSYHVPWLVEIKTCIPKPKIFRFKNYWLLHDNFLSVLQDTWSQPIYQLDPGRRLMAKFKRARKALSQSQKQLPKLANTIDNIKLIIQFIDLIKVTRDLTVQEWNIRDILTHQLQNMLEQ